MGRSGEDEFVSGSIVTGASASVRNAIQILFSRFRAHSGITSPRPYLRQLFDPIKAATHIHRIALFDFTATAILQPSSSFG